MKPNTHARLDSRGFALVVTLSLMVLLTLIAVGLLSISAVSLRGSSQGMAQAEARANARLALILAIGDLQKHLGPDRAITATSEILGMAEDAVAKPNTAGVWESWWDFNPSVAPDYAAEKTSRFRRWLVSSADLEAPRVREFVTTPWTGKTIELVGNGALGTITAPAAKATAGLVPISGNGKAGGAYAWHVSDESVKARVNLYRDPLRNSTLAQKRALLAGHRPDPSVMKHPTGTLLTGLPTDLSATEFAKATATVGKLTDLDQAELLDQAEDKIKPFRNDITPYSLGVLADVRGGGLKQDLSSMFEMGGATANTLPQEFNNKKLYQSTHGITGISDPNWSALAGYYNSFRSLTAPETSPSFIVKQAAISDVPVPVGYNPAPVIAKVDTIFSLVARPTSDIFWINSNNGSNGRLDVKGYHDYHLNLIFTPVVVLHNPYNVNLSFHKMEVTFENIPVAFNFMFQAGGSGGFVSQSVEPGKFEAINTMSYSGAEHNGRTDKIFVMNIANWKDAEPIATSPNIVAPIVMKPGQTLVCGPFFPPNASFKSDSSGGHQTLGFDWDNRLTKAIKAKPSYTPGLGYEMYAVTIAHFRRQGGLYPGGWTGHPFMMLRGVAPVNPKISQSTVTDNFFIEFKVQRPGWYQDDSTTNKGEASPSFAVNAKLQATNTGTPVSYARLQFDYKDDSSLKRIFDDRVYRYPPTGSYTVSDCAAPGGVTYSKQDAYVRQFAIFSAYARTTGGGVFETNQRTKSPTESPEVNLLKDGRLAGKPFVFHNPSRSNFITNLAIEKPAAQAYELNFQPFLSKGDYQDYMDVDATNRVPSLTGNKTTTGIKSGSYLELPSGPLQTIADFRRSNALTTSYLPQFVQPVGNSLLHPLMSADKVVETNPGITKTQLLDHSVLANHALYDRFYFSTFGTRGGETPEVVFEKFMNGTVPLASQAFRPYLPAGRTAAEAKSALFNVGKPKDDAYKAAAEFQLIQGPFNVNSTSVQAWKAVLASMKKSDVATLWARTAGLEINAATGVPLAPMSLVNGGANPGPAVDAGKIDNQRTNLWNGYRELSDSELENLAVKIVNEVRVRGPFLSMSEFVNRQVGPAGPRTLQGALEAAITESEINEAKGALPPATFLAQVPITRDDLTNPKLYNYKTPEATTGNPAAGAPGWVNQGDLLRILEPSATVRGDTFVIRAYGEAQDTNGTITARAYVEAVVQRVPEYVDPANRPSLNVYNDPEAAVANKTFGRRFNIVSFRWLSPTEI
jgi:hypothetical protein